MVYLEPALVEAMAFRDDRNGDGKMSISVYNWDKNEEMTNIKFTEVDKRIREAKKEA